MALPAGGPHRVAESGFTVLSDPPHAVIDIVFVHGLQGHPLHTWTSSVSSTQSSGTQGLLSESNTSKRRSILPHRRQDGIKALPDVVVRQAEETSVTAQGTCWPRDLLKDDFPEARILTFGYDTHVAQGYHAVNKSKLFTHAKNLLVQLEQRRRKAVDRDLVFIAHSLGGILVKEVLRRSEINDDPRTKKIFKSTTGVFFFGTPHRGSDQASLAQIAAFAAGHLLRMDTNDAIIQALLPDSTELDICKESFIKQWMKRREILNVRTFQEGKPMTGFKGFNDLIVRPFSSSLDHEDERAVTFNRNHSEMVKFTGRDDPDYETVKLEIEDFVTNAKKKKRVPSFEAFSEQDKRECLQMLRSTQYEEAKDRNPNRLDGTCLWFLDHEYYTSWNESTTSTLLWVTADPGCGKSVLARYLAEHLVEPESDPDLTDNRTVTYFFFKKDSEEQMSAAHALAALLHQLFSKNDELIQYAMKIYQSEGSKLLQNFQKLWKILIDVASDPKAGEVVCILDGLDECAEAGCNQIIDALKDHYKRAIQEPGMGKLKFLITSRPYPELERRFGDLVRNVPTVRLQGEHNPEAISREIDTVIDSEIAMLTDELHLNLEERRIIETKLHAIENRTYLWVKLVFEVLHETIDPTRESLEQVVDNLPPNIDAAYDAILSRVSKRDQPKARKLLSIVVTARRPLTVQELNVALALNVDQTSWDEVEGKLHDNTKFNKIVRNLCGLFVTVADNRVYLIHQTARDFLIAEERASESWNYSLELIQAELVLTASCAVVISLEDTDDRANDFFLYASYFWTTHYQRTEKEATGSLIDLAFLICDEQHSRYAEWTMHFKRIDSTPNLPNCLAFASYLGHYTIAERLLANDYDGVDSKDLTYGRTPLAWAVRGGYTDVARLLLDTGVVDIECLDYEGRTPLGIACHLGQEEVALFLLGRNADVGYHDNGNTSALSDAAFAGLQEIVKWILNKTPNLILQKLMSRYNSRGSSVLHLAIQSRHEDRFQVIKMIVRKLSTFPPDQRRTLLFHQDHGQCNPMFLAAQLNRAKTIKLLANSDKKLLSERGWHGWEDTPLHVASHWQNLAAVKALLTAGADPNTRQRSGRTPLHIAAGRPDSHDGVSVVKVLLGDADPLIEADDGTNIVHVALRNDMERNLAAIKDHLLQQNPHQFYQLLTSKNKAGYIPMFHLENLVTRAEKSQIAQTRTFKAVCQCMLQIVLEADAATLMDMLDESNRPLAVHRFIETGSDELVVNVVSKLATLDRTLLSAKDPQGRSSLIKAVDFHQYRATQLLIELGVDVNAQDSLGKTALHYAVERDDAEAAQTLAIADASFDLRDKSGRTPLEECSSRNKCYAVLNPQLQRRATSDIERNLKRIQSQSTQWAVTFGATRRSCDWILLGDRDWLKQPYTEAVHRHQYLVSDAIPTSAKLPITQVHVVIEGRDQGWSSDKWFWDRPENSFTSDTGFHLAIVRNDSIVLQLEWCRNPHRSKTPHRFEATWFSDTVRNTNPSFCGRRPAGEDDQGDFVRRLMVGDQVAVVAAADGEGWLNITKSASIEICFEM